MCYLFTILCLILLHAGVSNRQVSFIVESILGRRTAGMTKVISSAGIMILADGSKAPRKQL